MTANANASAKAAAAARSSSQREMVAALLRGDRVYNAAGAVRGRAAQYAGRYGAAQGKLIGRLRAAGLEVQFQPGPRGGQSSGYYYLAADACA